MIWFRSANSHTGPQLHRCIRGRTDGSIRLRADLLQKPLASRGASTDEYAKQTGKGRHFRSALKIIVNLVRNWVVVQIYFMHYNFVRTIKP